MTSNPEADRRDRRIMSLTAAAMYGGAALLSLVEGAIAGTRAVPVPSTIVAVAVVAGLLLGARRMPGWILVPLGPLGVALIAYAIATSPGADGAIVYVWPVVWTAYFYGRRGAIGIVACVATAQGLALVLAPAAGHLEHWVDVVISAAVVAFVVQVLARRNQYLLACVAAEARTDALTHLLNRRGFEECAALILEQARRDGQSVAIACFDLDHFKRINDEWGHDVGDRVLTDFAALLDRQSRGVDAVARTGGEEFVALLPGCDARGADAFTQRVRTALQTYDSNLPSVRVSAGVAAAVSPTNFQALLRNADAALYAAKRAGRNRTVGFEAGESRAATVARRRFAS